MRQRLIGLLRDTSNLDAASFDEWFNDLDWLASVDSAESLGAVLLDEREAKALKAVRLPLDAMWKDLGDAGFAAYQADPRWPELQAAARDATAVMCAS